MTAQGSVAVAFWNYAAPDGTGALYTMPTSPAGPAKVFRVAFANVPQDSAVRVWRIDDDHGNALKAFDAMGRPQGDLTKDQVAKLQAAGSMASPERMRLNHGRLELTVPAHGLAVVMLER
jgi:xylan 1,4-beta-xylosidase